MKWPLTNWRTVFFAICAFSGLKAGCDDGLLGPDSELQMSSINNVIWTLATAEENGNRRDLSIYPPFHLIYDDDQFFGDDGCNWFGGLYDAQNDSIFPGQISQTLRLCIRASFPVEHLAEPYRLKVYQDRLRLLSGRNIYTYRSNFRAPLDNSGVVANWQLAQSNDPEFEEIEAQGLIPSLSLNADRTFSIVWDCRQDNPFGCDNIGGLFGINTNGKITFYEREGSYHGEGPGENFMHRILASSMFTVEPIVPKGGTLILKNPADGRVFEFRSIVR